MKIYGIFRGFPGLGRVVSGVSILKRLEKEGYEIKAYTYLQGLELLRHYEIPLIIEEQPVHPHIMVIGLNPISKEGGILIERVVKDNPDLVVIDGEPLLTSTLSYVYPKERIISLLNPADIINKSLPLSSQLFYRYHYLAVGTSIIHGLTVGNYNEIGKLYNCNIFSINTILRNEIINLKNNIEPKYMVGIIGGGCSNCSKNFFDSSKRMINKIIKIAKELPDEQFKIYCNDKLLSENLEEINNIEIFKEFVSPIEIYKNAKIVICRAGRNTLSEISFLGIPTLLFAANDEFRTAEQNKNIIDVKKYFNEVDSISLDESEVAICQKIKNLLGKKNIKSTFVPGNEIVIDEINILMEKYCG